MSKALIKKIIEHPDKDEIISKLLMGIDPSEINEWLKEKYKNVSESRFVIAKKTLKDFKDDWLDIVIYLQEDLKNTRDAVSSDVEGDLVLSIKNNSAYKSQLLKLAGKELDIKEMITNLCLVVEARLGQIFDSIQEDPANINTRTERVALEYMNTLGAVLEKYQKLTQEQPGMVVQNNLTIQVVDQHISVLHETIRDVLAQMDLESSMYFMEQITEKMNKLKPPSEQSIPSADVRLAETKLLNEAITKKIDNDKE